MTKLIRVLLGTGLGGVLRFPSGMLVVNVSDCLAIGFLSAAVAGPVPSRERSRIALLIGVPGRFTTFSAFGREWLGV